MLNLNIFSFLIILTCLYQAQATYSLVWSDEFDGTSLNLGSWNIDERDKVDNNELEAYTKGNIYVSNGLLHMIAKKEHCGDKAYTSGAMNSQGKKAFLYGRFEARMKMPAGKGLWPAFWLLPNDYDDWPVHGEIDIMEVLGHDLYTLYGSLHMGASGQDINGGAGFGGKTKVSGTYDQDFHIYAVDWTPEKITWSVDGRTYFTAQPSQTSPYWPFTGNKFYIIFNLAVGGNWPGAPDSATVFPNEFLVDYVRVYQNNAFLSI